METIKDRYDKSNSNVLSDQQDFSHEMRTNPHLAAQAPPPFHLVAGAAEPVVQKKTADTGETENLESLQTDRLIASGDDAPPAKAQNRESASMAAPVFHLTSGNSTRSIQKQTANTQEGNPEEVSDHTDKEIANGSQDPPPVQKKRDSMVLQRVENTTPSAKKEEKGKITGKFFSQQKVDEKEFSYAKAKLNFKGEAEYAINLPEGSPSYEISIGKKDGKAAGGIKKELEQQASKKFLGADWKVKESGEWNTEGGELAVEGGFEGDEFFGSVKFTPVAFDLDKMEFKFANLALEFGGKIIEIKNYPISFIPGATVDAKFSGSFIVELEPNYKQIAIKIAERVGLGLGEGLVVDTAAVGAAASAIAVPFLAGALMIAGAMQTDKNIMASHAAIAAGTQFRKHAREYAKDYAGVLISGHQAKGEGGRAAESKLIAWMLLNNGTRDLAVKAAMKSNGAYQVVYQKILKESKDDYYPKAFDIFCDKYKDQFGFIESFGDDWGMKGVFKNDLRMVLYADDF